MGIKILPPSSNINVADTKLKLISATKLRDSSSEAHSNTETLRALKQGSKSAVPKLSDEEQAQISKLKARDTQVHQHEQAHLSAAAGLNVSGASFTYQKGPNGVNYAVAGEVRIDTSPGHTPEETLARAEKIADAALAPADPSAVDRSVAAKAQNMAQQARVELMQEARDVNKHADHSDASRKYENIAPAKINIDTYA